MIVTAPPGVDLVQTEARTYFERKRIGQILECLVTGLIFSRPEDPLAYIEECVHRLRVGDLPEDKSQLKWDVFIPPPLQSSTAIAAATLPRPTSVKRPKNAVPPLRKRPAALPPMRQSGIDLPVVGGEKPLSKRSAGAKRGDGLADVANGGNQTGGGASLSSKPLPPIAHEHPVNTTTKTQLSPAWDNIVFVLGGPGCGKGTQCVRIAKDYNYCHLSAGDLLRDEVATGSELGQELNQMMKEGKIVPMHVTIRLLKEAMERAPPTFSGFLIDGFPRQLDQAVAFEEQIRPCKFVLYFECSEAVMEKRLLKRGETSGRADDNMETIKKRFKTFLDTSLPVIRAFAEKGKCVQISSEPAPEEVYAMVKKSFDAPPPLNHPNVVFVLGGPGSGKGTQCVRLAKEFNLAHLSTGDLLRAEIEKGSAIGQEVEGIMKEGKMVPMRIIMGLLRNAMEQNINTPGFLIDGFPRAMSQVVEFEKSIGPCRTVLYFTCSLQTLEQRLLERGKTSGRVDDNLETIRKRFRTFMNESVEVVEWYKQKGKVIEISSEAPIEEVYQNARKVFVQEKRLDHPNVNFILGGPGSGKGTQCVRLAKDFSLKHISTGDLLRAEVEQGTETGRIAQDIMVQGKMVPMDLIMGLLVKEIKDNFSAKGFLIDGFPRSLDQTLAFERAVGVPRQVLYFKCPLDVLEQRLLERGKTSGRADDTLETIKQRFVTYEKESLPVVEHYRKTGKLVEISSVPPVDEVYQNAQQYFQDSLLTTSEQPRPFDGRNLVFVLGGPGSGKGTQCAKLVDELHWAHLSTGDLLREEVARGSALGKKLEADMKEGKMVSMDVTLQLLLQAMKERSDAKGFLIDGFPRTMEQAKVFEDTIGRCTFVLYFSANHDVLTARLLERGKTSGRADDNAESIAKRLKTFDEMSLPVIQHFARDERVKEVVSEGSIDEITSRTLQCFEELD